MAVGATFHPKSWGVALLEALYDVKFSKHTPLIVVLLSMIYTIYHYAPAMIMTLIQATQMIFIFCFIIAADLEEREKLRVTYTEHARDLKQSRANTCPHCEKPVTSNNRARHIASCPSNPANQ